MSELPRPPEAHQFDFWIGTWNVEWGEGKRGTNVIQAALDDAVIVENFDGRPGTSLRGISVSTYNTQLGTWQQTWVDNQGSYLDFTGEFKDGRMILQRRAALNGALFLQRMVWYNLTPDQLDWNWERSDDGGQTWQVLWSLHYTRQV